MPRSSRRMIMARFYYPKYRFGDRVMVHAYNGDRYAGKVVSPPRWYPAGYTYTVAYDQVAYPGVIAQDEDGEDILALMWSDLEGRPFEVVREEDIFIS